MKSTEALLKVLDSSLNGTMVFTPVKDRQNRIVDFKWQLINRQAALLLGKEPSDLLGKKLLDELPDHQYHGLFDKYLEVVETGKSRVFDIEYGNSETSSWFHVQAVKMDDDLVTTFFDITKLKQVEAELIRKEKLLTEAQDLANLGSWSWNLIDNTIHWSNNVYKIYEIEDRSFKPSYSFFIDCLVPEDKEKIQSILEKAIENSQPYDINYRVQVGDKLKFLEARAIPKIGANRKAQEYIGIVRDVTLEKTQEEELRRSENRARRAEKVASSERMAKSVAHEIRNPLTNIALATEQLKSEVESESGELFLDLISRNSQRIEDLIRKLMDSARQATLTTKPHNINDILDDTISLAMDRVRLRRVKILKNFESDMCDILVDREKVKTALLNITINGIEAISKNGEVLIETKLTDQECIVTISDNGAGIEKDKLNQLFDPFYTGKKRGLGLGLTTALNILNSHDANVEVESELGKGTTFIISFNRN